MRTYILQNEDGQITGTHSISAGLDYPGVGPEHAWLKDSGRAEYMSATDEQALRGFRACTEKEGIIPALETAHAIWATIELAKTLPKEQNIVMVRSSSLASGFWARWADARSFLRRLCRDGETRTCRRFPKSSPNGPSDSTGVRSSSFGPFGAVADFGFRFSQTWILEPMGRPTPLALLLPRSRSNALLYTPVVAIVRLLLFLFRFSLRSVSCERITGYIIAHAADGSFATIPKPAPRSICSQIDHQPSSSRPLARKRTYHLVVVNGTPGCEVGGLTTLTSRTIENFGAFGLATGTETVGVAVMGTLILREKVGERVREDFVLGFGRARGVRPARGLAMSDDGGGGRTGLVVDEGFERERVGEEGGVEEGDLVGVGGMSWIGGQLRAARERTVRNSLVESSFASPIAFNAMRSAPSSSLEGGLRRAAEERLVSATLFEKNNQTGGGCSPGLRVALGLGTILGFSTTLTTVVGLLASNDGGMMLTSIALVMCFERLERRASIWFAGMGAAEMKGRRKGNRTRLACIVLTGVG